MTQGKDGEISNYTKLEKKKKTNTCRHRITWAKQPRQIGGAGARAVHWAELHAPKVLRDHPSLLNPL